MNSIIYIGYQDTFIEVINALEETVKIQKMIEVWDILLQKLSKCKR